MPKSSSLGVMIERNMHYSTDHITVLTMRREDGAEHPLNISFGMFEDHGDYADLVLDGFVSDRSHELIAFEPSYRDVHSVDLARAKAMGKVLAKMRRIMQAEHCTEHGDVYSAFCKAIGAKWVVIGDRRGGSLADLTLKNWRWLTIPEGRAYLRDMIAKAEAESRERETPGGRERVYGGQA